MPGYSISLDPGGERHAAGLAPLIATMGSGDFGHRLFDLVSRECGAVHCMSAEVRDGVPQIMSLLSGEDPSGARENYDRYSINQHWKVDPVIEIARDTADFSKGNFFHVPRDLLPSGVAQRIYEKHTSDRLVLIQALEGKLYLMALFRTPAQGEFSDHHVEKFCEIGSALVAATARHAWIAGGDQRVVQALTSLNEIEARMDRLSAELSSRERQVCARIIYGMSNAGIALDLGVGEQTSITYKKRAFSRLEIGSNRELLHRYLNCLT